MSVTVSKHDTALAEALARLADRNDTIEISTQPTDDIADAHVVRYPNGTVVAPTHTTWRVRVLAASAEEIIVERPWSIDQKVNIQPGDVLSVLVIDNNHRWSFETGVLDLMRFALNERQTTVALRLRWPDEVHNAQRRDYFRVDIAGAGVPNVMLWRVLDLASCVASERACGEALRKRLTEPPSVRLPQLGERFEARVIDVSGGGICVATGPALLPVLETLPLFWLKLTFPGLSQPLVVVGRPAHWREESTKLLRTGFAFTFRHNPAHEDVVRTHMCRVAAHYQRLQLRRKR